MILYTQPDDKKKNRGFCFLEYEDHKSAAQARRRLMSGKVKVWGTLVTVEWADPIEDPDPEIMAKVKDTRRRKKCMFLLPWFTGQCKPPLCFKMLFDVSTHPVYPPGEGAVCKEPGQ